jgi:hypothetical protein
MTTNLFCLVDGQTISQAFDVEIESTKTISHLKKLIKAEKSNQFINVDANNLTLWKVSIPITPENKQRPIVLKEIDSPKKLDDPTDEITVEFEGILKKNNSCHR